MLCLSPEYLSDMRARVLTPQQRVRTEPSAICHRTATLTLASISHLLVLQVDERDELRHVASEPACDTSLSFCRVWNVSTTRDPLSHTQRLSHAVHLPQNPLLLTGVRHLSRFRVLQVGDRDELWHVASQPAHQPRAPDHSIHNLVLSEGHTHTEVNGMEMEAKSTEQEERKQKTTHSVPVRLFCTLAKQNGNDNL